MTASSSAADSRPPKYDVFISFRGEDTRKGFTSHLYYALSGKQIEAYIDEVSLEKGDTISRALPEAIKESEISIIIFSENYGESRWCLDELVHILKRREDKDQIVLPIFYNIDPSHIRNQKETYAAFFVKHEECFEMEKVQKWRQTLKDATDISGWDSREMSESKILEEVVECVQRELDTINSKRSDDFKGLVGISERLEKIKSFVDSPTVRVVGIWGMGGIGKTTLARVVFNQFYNDFEGSYFAPNVRENVHNKGLETFEREVYSKLFGDKNLDTFKSSVVNRRLSRTKALLVLDDVENPMQLKHLAGDRYQFGPGSKIIVTSRHKLKVDVEYKVEVLDFDDACKLFYLNAFGEKCCKREYKEISDRVVEYTKGHPLALEVLGASVFCFLESIEEWEKDLEKLKRIPNDEIQNVLKISYDALDPEQKGLFLDIACFLKGQRRDFVEGILEGKPITGLVNKSLITIEDGRICMHDLIEEMGRNIVLRSTEKLGERSRLWIAQDVSYVLKNNKGTEAIEGIYLPLNEEDEEVHLRPDVFEEMRKLRLLKFYDASRCSVQFWSQKVNKEVHLRPVVRPLAIEEMRKFYDASHYFVQFGSREVNKVYIDGDLKYLPNGLRYLHWEHYPVNSLPSKFKPQNLVDLQMPNSKLEQLWDGVQELGSLRHINLRNSIRLTKIPDLSQAPKLESINLCGCLSLIHIPSLNLQATLDDESEYWHWWRIAKLNGCHHEDKRSAGSIILCRCVNLTTLPKLSGNIRQLVLRETALKELPSSIESLENLLHLDLRKCKKLNSFPRLPRNIKVLEFDDSGIEQIPSSSIECLCSLLLLSLRNCQSLASEFIPKTLCKFTGLKELSFYGCSKLESLPMLSGLCSLTKLDLSHLELGSLPMLSGLCSLTELDLSHSKLESLPTSIGMLYKLKVLDIRYCRNLQSLPELPLFIKSVRADECSSLEMVSTLRSPLILGRWLDEYDGYGHNYRIEFSFENCRKLGEDAINNIFREFLYKVFCTATIPPEEVDSARKVGKVRVRYPISHIPRWFNNQSEGSSITIPLPTNWYNPKTFLGFVVSLIVVPEFYSGSLLGRFVECIIHLMTAGDRFRVVEDCGCYVACELLDPHIVMLYNYFDHSKVDFEKEYVEASFEFRTPFEFRTQYLKVERCGVRMLYLRDTVEKFDVNNSDSANFESWRIDVK